MQAQSLSWKDPLAKGMAVDSSTLTWRILTPWAYSPECRKESDMIEVTWYTGTHIESTSDAAETLMTLFEISCNLFSKHPVCTY